MFVAPDAVAAMTYDVLRKMVRGKDERGKGGGGGGGRGG